MNSKTVPWPVIWFWSDLASQTTYAYFPATVQSGTGIHLGQVLSSINGVSAAKVCSRSIALTWDFGPALFSVWIPHIEGTTLRYLTEYFAWPATVASGVIRSIQELTELEEGLGIQWEVGPHRQP